MSRNLQQRISRGRALLGNPYAHLNDKGEYDAIAPQGAVTAPLIDKNQLLDGSGRARAYARRDIARIVRKLHVSMWRNRERIFGSNDVDPLLLLNPSVALEALGFSVVIRESLGQHAAGKESYEVAGIVDSANSSVEISRRFRPHQRNFTTAHELGHAVLHDGVGLHRDRSPDGAGLGTRPPQEMDADLFASLFLLPEKQVRAAFRRRFLVDQFTLSENTAFALTGGSLRDLQKNLRNGRDLARKLAGAHSYNGSQFSSLAERFGVSIEAMVIRIEELGLVKSA